MHTAIVDIAIQENSAKALTSHFHTVVPFHDLLTIWFSFGQTVLRSAFRVLVNPLAFPAYVFTGYPFRTRNPPFPYFKELYIISGDNLQYFVIIQELSFHHSIFKKQRNFLRCVGGTIP